MAGLVEQIAISSTKHILPERVERVEVRTGQGPVGDRYFSAEPVERDGKDLTLIALEALEALETEAGIALSHEQSRRNVLTRDVPLNDLVGKRFRVGEVECEGVKLAEPCAELERMTHPGVLRGLVHRGGLRANVLRGGTIAVGDEIRELPQAASGSP